MRLFKPIPRSHSEAGAFSLFSMPSAIMTKMNPTTTDAKTSIALKGDCRMIASTPAQPVAGGTTCMYWNASITWTGGQTDYLSHWNTCQPTMNVAPPMPPMKERTKQPQKHPAMMTSSLRALFFCTVADSCGVAERLFHRQLQANVSVLPYRRCYTVRSPATGKRETLRRRGAAVAIWSMSRACVLL
jgi:hypothetical protein